MSQNQYFPTWTGNLSCVPKTSLASCATFTTCDCSGLTRPPCLHEDPVGRQTALQSQGSCAHPVSFLFLCSQALQTPDADSSSPIQPSPSQRQFAHSLPKQHRSFLQNSGAATLPSRSPADMEQTSQDPPPSLMLLSPCPHVVTRHTTFTTNCHCPPGKLGVGDG